MHCISIFYDFGIWVETKFGMKRIAFILSIACLTSSGLYAQSKDKVQLNKYLTGQSFSGAVLTVNTESEIIETAVGYSDLENTQPIDINIKFKIASITKLFTAVIVMQLVEEGKTTLATTIDEVLPAFEITNAAEITIRQLMQHTSGLGNERNTSYLKGYTPDELIKTFATKKAKFKPGSDLNYNNIDFTILGKMIEELTGKSYLEILNERITAPLKMADTGLLVEKDLPSDISESFEIRKGVKKSELKIHLENFWAAGSMFSTTRDLLKFSDALKTNKLLSEKAKAQLFKSEPSLGYVALGCWTFNTPFIKGRPKVLERRGGILGSTSVLMTSLNGPETLIILSNTNGFNPDTFGQSDNMKEYLFKTLFTVND